MQLSSPSPSDSSSAAAITTGDNVQEQVSLQDIWHLPQPISAHCANIVNVFFTTLLASIPSNAPLQSTTFLPPAQLLTTCKLVSYHLGNGLTMANFICREMLSAKREILFVTAFWYPGPSQELMRLTLRELNRLHANRDPYGRKLRVTIGFSSTSFIQKLFQTSSRKGKVWASNPWECFG